MRIIIIAPEQPGIDTIPEVRAIQSWHSVSTLSGRVTSQDIYRACQDTNFDVLHFATHGGPQGIALSDGELFTAEDVAQVARIHDTQGVFFNTCESGVLAAYAVRHGVKWAVSAETKLLENGAWKMPYSFYSALRNGNRRDFVGAYILADSGDGDYSLIVSPTYLQELIAMATMFRAQPAQSVILSRRMAATMVLFLLAASTLLAVVINYLAGNF